LRGNKRENGGEKGIKGGFGIQMGGRTGKLSEKKPVEKKTNQKYV